MPVPAGGGHVRRYFMTSDADRRSILLLIVRRQGQVLRLFIAYLQYLSQQNKKRHLREKKLGRSA